MSYILDALKRADAERERGHVPGLHSQVSHVRPEAPPAATPTGTQRRHWLLWAVLATVVAGTVAALFWPTAPTPPALPPVVAPAAPAPVPPAPAVPLNTPAPGKMVEAEAPSAPTPTRPILAPLPPAPPPPASASEPPAASAKAAAPGDKAPRGATAFAALTPEQRAQLPQLSISGASYSSNPAHRLLIVNGQVLKEGQEIAPGLVLEHIGLNEAVLNQRGLRFRIGY